METTEVWISDREIGPTWGREGRISKGFMEEVALEPNNEERVK